MTAAPMSMVDIQARLDALAVAMCAKGLREPNAHYLLRSQCECHVLLSWMKGASGYGMEFEHPGTLNEADAWVRALPSPEEARLEAFLASLDETIQLGKKADVEVEHINPMIEILKRISKNAITHQVQA